MNYNPYPQVNLPFGKDNKWFVYLFEALIRVDRSFIEYEILGRKGDWHLCVPGRSRTRRYQVPKYEVYVKGYIDMGPFANLMERVEYIGKATGRRALLGNGEIVYSY